MNCSKNKKNLENIQYFSFITHKREPIMDMNVLIGNNYINGTIINIRDENIKVNIIGDNSIELFHIDDFKNRIIKKHIFNTKFSF